MKVSRPRLLLVTIVGAGLGLLVFGFLASSGIDLVALDGVKGYIYGSLELSGAPTFFATGYSHPRFRKVRTGMTPDEVRGILGPPLVREPSFGRGGVRSDLWGYASGHVRGQGHLRNVVFIGGVVARIESEYRW